MENWKDEVLHNPSMTEHAAERFLIESVVKDEIYNHQWKNQKSVEADAKQRKRAPYKNTPKEKKNHSQIYIDKQIHNM